MILPPHSYDLRDHFWVLRDGRVYSSAAGAYVTSVPADRPFTPIAAEQDLVDLLGAAGLALPAGASLSDTERTRQVSSADRVVLTILFNHENRIRALEGKASITRAQFLNALKALL